MAAGPARPMTPAGAQPAWWTLQAICEAASLRAPAVVAVHRFRQCLLRRSAVGLDAPHAVSRRSAACQVHGIMGVP